MANSSGRETARERWRRERQRQLLLRWAARIGAAIAGSGIIVMLVMLFLSSTSQLDSAQVDLRLTAYDYAGGGAPSLISRKPAGKDATLALAVLGSSTAIPIAPSATAPAHQDAGLNVDALCTLSIVSVSGSRIVTAAIDQRAIIDLTTGMVTPTLPAIAGVHTDHFWELAQPFALQNAPLVTSPGIATTFEFTIARFGKSDLPLESYQITLSLTITGAGDIGCSLFAPSAPANRSPIAPPRL
jgi:hypothetical protein